MARDKVDVAKRMVDAYNLRDVDGGFAELVTPDFEWYPAIARAFHGGVYRGREGVERFLADSSENWEELQIIAGEFRDLGSLSLPPYLISLLPSSLSHISLSYHDRAEGLRVAGLSE